MLKKISVPKNAKKTDKKTLAPERILITKKFVTVKDLFIVCVICLFYLINQIMWIRGLPTFLIVVIVLPVLLIVWHKSYQVLYDFKLFFFNNQFDVKADYPPEKRLPAITFIVPSCQEPFNVAKMTFDSIVKAPYNGNKEIIVIDNSNDTSTKDFIEWNDYVERFTEIYPNENVSAKFLYNNKNETLKPGNLDLGQTSIQEGEFVVFLDVDSTLPDSGNLLEQSVAQFEADSKLGFIQFRIKATNNHFNVLTQTIAVSQDLLRLRMISRGYGGQKIFEGHNGIWRKSALESSGPWTEYFRGNIIITEDILKSAHAYSTGYYGKPLNIETGEWVPNSLQALESMWMRWMYGNSQVFFKSLRKIYSKKNTMLEMFDITFHMTTHLVVICFFLIAIFFQLAVPGSITNIFIISFWVFPQLVGALISYFTSVRKMHLPMTKKIKYIYISFFMVETFIMFVQIKSDVRFILGKRQGWKVTEKGFERLVGWKRLIINNSFYLSLAILLFVSCFISWIFNYDMAFNSIRYHFASLFMGVNLVLCIILYGQQRRKPHNVMPPPFKKDVNSNKLSKVELTNLEVL